MATPVLKPNTNAAVTLTPGSGRIRDIRDLRRVEAEDAARAAAQVAMQNVASVPPTHIPLGNTHNVQPPAAPAPKPARVLNRAVSDQKGSFRRAPSNLAAKPPEPVRVMPQMQPPVVAPPPVEEANPRASELWGRADARIRERLNQREVAAPGMQPQPPPAVVANPQARALWQRALERIRRRRQQEVAVRRMQVQPPPAAVQADPNARVLWERAVERMRQRREPEAVVGPQEPEETGSAENGYLSEFLSLGVNAITGTASAVYQLGKEIMRQVAERWQPKSVPEVVKEEVLEAHKEIPQKPSEMSKTKEESLPRRIIRLTVCGPVVPLDIRVQIRG